MHTWHSHVTRNAVVSLVALTAFTVSCREVKEPTDPLGPGGVAGARAAGSGNPTVSSVTPDNSQRGLTLDVAVNGSGYDQGSVARLERQGVPAAKITTNSTTFVTTRKLIANITIAADADTGKYDVAVITASGRKGVGIELFTVTYVLDELGIIGGTWSRAHAINDQGEVVGASCTQDCLGTAFYWTEAGGLEDMGTLPGFSRSGAYAINSRGQAFGEVFCRISDAACGGVYTQQLVRWDKVDGNWSITPVNGCSIVRPVAEGSEKFLINNNDQCVKQASTQTLLIQTLSGGAVASEETLPSPTPGALSWATAISDAPMVAGYTTVASNAFAGPVIWYRNATGVWAALRLGFPGSDNMGRATDIGDPDAAGNVRVTGFTQDMSICCKGNSPRERAVLWTLQPDGFGGLRVASIQVLGGVTQGPTTNSWGRAVNRDGRVVGHSGQYFNTGTPVTWPIDAGMQSLPTPGGGSSGRAVDVNNQGWIVGAVFDQSRKCDRAAIWRQR